MSTQTETAIVTKEVKPIDSVRNALEKMKPQFQMALPKHITPDRMFRVVMTAIQQTPKLLECDKQSLFAAVMRAAQLGLEPDGILGQAYLIPYAGKVQFIVGYKGLIDLARRSGEVSNIIAKEVCESDVFKITWHDEVPFKHEQPISGDRGKIIGFWALARFKDGGFHWDYLTAEEVIGIRNQSSGWQSAVKFGKTKDSPWEKHFVEMGKKTAIRRIAKYLPMSVQKAAMFEDLADSGKKFSDNEFGEIIIEGESTDVAGVLEEKEKKTRKSTSKLDEFAKDNSSVIEHDPETGEIIEEENIAPVVLPAAIPARALPGNATATDWDSWSFEWIKNIGLMTDKPKLEKLRKLNESVLSNLQKVNPQIYSSCMGEYEICLAIFEQAVAA